MTHVRTSPYYPQSNGKLKRFNKTLKTGSSRPNSPDTADDARRIVTEFVEHYNGHRLHSAIGYVTPTDKLAGREAEIWALCDQRLEAACARRQQRRLGVSETPPKTHPVSVNSQPNRPISTEPG